MSGKIVGMRDPAQAGEGAAGGCAFLIDGVDAGPGGVNFCNAPREVGSAYSPRHRALCHLPKGSAAEGRQLCVNDALAEAVGGRLGREARHPPDRLLRRLDRIDQIFFWPKRS